MKLTALVLATATVILFAGCSTNRGGTTDEFNTITNSAEGNPEPAGSPTMRPGLNPRDPRDPQFLTRPQPEQPPQP